MKGWEEKIRKDHIKALDKGDLVLIIFGSDQDQIFKVDFCAVLRREQLQNKVNKIKITTLNINWRTPAELKAFSNEIAPKHSFI
jgi:hypothetical protein